MGKLNDSRLGLIGRGIASLLVGVSANALLMGSAAAQIAPAAETTPADSRQVPPGAVVVSDTPGSDSSPDIVVRGIRQSLASAQSIKRNADTVVDAITAEDIGALPDRSVTETLQRVPGVSISRYELANDPDHFSVEGQGVTIRGLPYVESQFNGRDAFTASRGRALNFQDIPPELLGSVEVYKNQTADQIEGGIAGNVNLITRRPLDTNKNIFAFTAEGNYGDLSKKWAPAVSGLISTQWNTGIGRIGILGSASYSRLFSTSDSVDISSWSVRRNADPTRGIAGIGSALPGLQPGVDYYIPVGAGAREQRFDRVRRGFAAALQWESNDRDLLATFQFIRSDTTQRWNEDTFEVQGDYPESSQVLVPGSPNPTFDRQNRLLTGSFTQGGTGTAANGVPNGGIVQAEQSRGVDEGSITDDFSLHLKWNASSRLKFDFDAQYTDSSAHDTDLGLYTATWADQTFDFTGKYPKVTLTPPSGARYTSFSDPRSTFYRAAIDHIDQNDGSEFALRGDGEFDFADDSLLRRIRFGARYAEREQVIRSDAYNWGNLSETWNGGPVFVSDIQPAGIGLHRYDGDFFRGDASHVPAFGYLPNAGVNYGAATAAFLSIGDYTRANRATCCGLWTPLAQRSGLLATNMGGDGIHRPGEFSNNRERTIAAYVRADFGWKNISALGGVTIDGNVGLRYVHTWNASRGFIQFPDRNAVFGRNIVCPAPVTDPPTPPTTYDLCANTAAQRAGFLAFADGSFQAVNTRDSYDDFLPSINLRLLATPRLQFRFAYAKAITRPSFEDLLNFTTFGLYTPATTGSGNPIPGFQANAVGNPLLRPTKADNFDLTAEWYFSNVGSFTIGGFYKRLTNVYAVSNGQTSLDANGVPINIDSGTATGTRTYTNAAGATQTAIFFGTNNNNNVTNVKGFEVAYQQTLTFLPSIFSGLGVSANYTYIDADKLKGLTNIYNTLLDFPGVSKHNINAEIFYEKYGISARVAYNWRSQYLITARDVVVPNQPTYAAATNQVDATFFYDVTPHVKIGIEGNNVLNENTRNLVQITSAGLLAPRVIFQTDRRLTLALRVRY